MADEEAPHDWDPEREKKQTDPDALARSFVRAAAEEQKKIEEEERKERVDRDMGRPARPGADYPPYPPPSMDLQMSVHKIRNGFVVTFGQGPHGHPLTIDLAETEYAKDQGGALAIVNRVTHDFLKAGESTAVAQHGFGGYPPPPAGFPGVEPA